MVDGQIAPGARRPRKGSLMHLQEPMVRVDGLGNSRQRRLGRAGHPRRLIATGARLVGALVIVVNEKRLRGLLDLLAGTWEVDLQALLIQRAMKPFHVGVETRADAGG
jgi:hypothetical protein